jgi:hypothetical protein
MKLILWGRKLFEELMVCQLVKKNPPFVTFTQLEGRAPVFSQLKPLYTLFY